MSFTPYIVGITGGSASGKTLFLNSLLSRFTTDQVCLISQDNYYRSKEEQPIDENGIENYDTPQSIDAHQYALDIQKLRSGAQVQRLEYNFNNETAQPNMLTFMPAPIIVVEGIFVFHFKEIADLMDLKIFIDADEHIKLSRRIKRDNEERGYGLGDVLYRYENHVFPTYKKYIEPYKQKSDIIIPNNNHFEKALHLIVTFLMNKTDQKISS